MLVGCKDRQETDTKYEPPTKEVLLTEWCSFYSIDEAKSIEFHLDKSSENANRERIFTIKERLEEDKGDPLWEQSAIRKCAARGQLMKSLASLRQGLAKSWLRIDSWILAVFAF
jgi:hypothetical protein